MKEYIGVDLGKRKAVVVKKDRQGKTTSKVTVPVTKAALESYFSKQDRRSQVVVEATGNWMYLYETIERYTRMLSWLIRLKPERLRRRASRPTP